MSVLDVEGLCKYYSQFQLEDISFKLDQGSIMGFIGRNGAGKSTTLKSILNLVHPDKGIVRCFDMEYKQNEGQIKPRLGYTAGAANYYMHKKISKVLEITSRFYANWDHDLCRKYLKIFSLDQDKTLLQLSEGMRVKLNLAIALSHHAELLILDEPTSGLDPVSRDEILEIFTFLKTIGTAILFSTHITTDIEKCADKLTYIVQGRLIASEPLTVFLARSSEEGKGNTLEEIMIYTEKEHLYEEFAK